MSFSFDDILKAYEFYKKYQLKKPSSSHHERFIFPLFSGTYFCYRKIDVLRIISIAKALSNNAKYIDIGCGNGDFLRRIRKYLPQSIGIEQNLLPLYLLRRLSSESVSGTSI